MWHGTYALCTRVRSMRRQQYIKKVLEQTKVFGGCSQRASEDSTGSKGKRNTKDL